MSDCESVLQEAYLARIAAARALARGTATFAILNRQDAAERRLADLEGVVCDHPCSLCSTQQRVSRETTGGL